MIVGRFGKLDTRAFSFEGGLALILREMVERFERRTPFAVMFWAILKRTFAAERLDAIFACPAQRQTQQGLIRHSDGREERVRRVSIELHEPTRDGETEIHVLTKLPERRVSALRVMQAYRQRPEGYEQVQY